MTQYQVSCIEMDEPRICHTEWSNSQRKTKRKRWLDGIIDSMDVSLRKLWEMVKDKKAWRAAVHGVTKSQARLNNWTELNHTLAMQPSHHAPWYLPRWAENLCSHKTAQT